MEFTRREVGTCITSGVMDLAGETGGGLRRKDAVGVLGLMPEDDDVWLLTVCFRTLSS